ncbi:DUF397 domain-containing protein [Nocardia suismassiliense]|uniref:DUF397 domain-containing protein n=1 Tax=Nocardia suismassiliense TaxID=2077092 RepID=A0ABW6QVM4_9NOCA
MYDMTDAHWFKSTHSSAVKDCVEVAHLDGGSVGVRDSKNPTGPALVFSPAAWDTFTSSLAQGDLNNP